MLISISTRAWLTFQNVLLKRNKFNKIYNNELFLPFSGNLIIFTQQLLPISTSIMNSVLNIFQNKVGRLNSKLMFYISGT